MTTNPQIERMAEALFSHEKKTMGDAWYHPSETFKGLGEQSQKPWILAAQAAYDASDARFVPILVGYIKKTIEDNLHLADGDNCTLKLLKDALAQIPKEYL